MGDRKIPTFDQYVEHLESGADDIVEILDPLVDPDTWMHIRLSFIQQIETLLWWEYDEVVKENITHLSETILMDSIVSEQHPNVWKQYLWDLKRHISKDNMYVRLWDSLASIMDRTWGEIQKDVIEYFVNEVETDGERLMMYLAKKLSSTLKEKWNK